MNYFELRIALLTELASVEFLNSNIIITSSTIISNFAIYRRHTRRWTVGGFTVGHNLAESIHETLKPEYQTIAIALSFNECVRVLVRMQCLVSHYTFLGWLTQKRSFRRKFRYLGLVNKVYQLLLHGINIFILLLFHTLRLIPDSYSLSWHTRSDTFSLS